MKKSIIAGWLILVIFLFGLAEIGSYAVLKLTPQLKTYVYAPPEVSEDAYNAYLANRHPVLGWPTANTLKKNADERGARLSPANDTFGDVASCVDVYGDSFAFGAEATDEQAWANVLAGQLGCRVDNYGVGGYGVGQALLRFEQNINKRPPAKTVILTIYPDNLVRNINQWRYLLTRNPLAFKPAFYVDGETVKLAPLFDGDHDGFLEVTADPATHLPAETYLPGAPSLRAPVKAGFPYSLTIASLALKLIDGFRVYDGDVRSNFYNHPSYYDTADGPSDEKKQVARYIISRFAEKCSDLSSRCVVVIMPDPELLYQQEVSGAHDLGWLKPDDERLIYLDGTEVFKSVEDICSHVTKPAGCSGHFNPDGYARMAAFIGDALKKAN